MLDDSLLVLDPASASSSIDLLVVTGDDDSFVDRFGLVVERSAVLATGYSEVELVCVKRLGAELHAEFVDAVGLESSNHLSNLVADPGARGSSVRVDDLVVHEGVQRGAISHGCDHLRFPVVVLGDQIGQLILEFVQVEAHSEEGSQVGELQLPVEGVLELLVSVDGQSPLPLLQFLKAANTESFAAVSYKWPVLL